MDKNQFPINILTAYRDPDGTVHSGCCIPGMVALFVAVGSGIYQVIQILS